MGSGNVLNEMRINSNPKRKVREIRTGKVGGTALLNLKELAGAIAMTTNASTAPTNDHIKRLKATPRVGRFIHIHAENVARASKEMITNAVGSEKPPRMKEKKKISG